MLPIAIIILTPLLLTRLLFLARFRVGWLMYLADVLFEVPVKKLHIKRGTVEIISAVAGLTVMSFSFAGWETAVVVAVILLIIELIVRNLEKKIIYANYAKTINGDPENYLPQPGLHPELVLNLEGPFIMRYPQYNLGSRPVDMEFKLKLIVGNHAEVPTQTPVKISLNLPEGWDCKGNKEQEIPIIKSGTVSELSWTLKPEKEMHGNRISINVSNAGTTKNISIKYDSCKKIEKSDIVKAEITRYPGGKQSAFSWRGDMDLYDTASFQSIEGLEKAFGLSKHYCCPQTMFLSTRLSLDKKAAEEWAEHYNIYRGADEIPEFIKWISDNVTLKYSAPYPCNTDNKYIVELGNHGHLHYDTDTASAPENNWKAGARVGDGKYSWLKDDSNDSFSEQRDNALEATRWIEEKLSFTTKSWAKPGRGNDASTAGAMAAAGCTVLTGSDIKASDNVLKQPLPHHPGNTDAVELTARYPSDPQHIFHLGMLIFWLNRAWRKKIPMIFLCHQHMRLFDGPVCSRFTEYLLRYVLKNFNGDFYVDTVYGIGNYWRKVLSPKTKRVEIKQTDKGITITNNSDTDFVDLPVDVTLKNGEKFTLLFDCKGGESVNLM